MKFGQVRQRPVHPPFGRCMDITKQLPAQILITFLMKPAKRVTEKIALNRRESPNFYTFFILPSLLKGVQPEQQSSIVRQIFTQTGATVDVQSRQRFVGIELCDHDLGSFLETS